MLNEANIRCTASTSQKATERDRSGRLGFFNLRSQLWWQMRELLDPQNDTGAALPPDPALLAELCAPKWELSGMTIRWRAARRL